MNRGQFAKTACLLAGIALLAGCTAAPPKETKAPEKAVAPAVEVKNDFDVQPGTAEDDYVGALKDVTVDRCESGDKGTEISGTVTNPTKKDADYRIYVSVMNDKDTLGIVQVDVAGLARGKTAEWSKKAKASDSDVRCVLRVERVAAR